MDNTFFDTADQIMDNCDKVISKAFDIGRKKCEKLFRKLYSDSERKDKEEELNSSVFQMLNLMLSVRDEPLRTDDEDGLTDTIISAFFKATELIVYSDRQDVVIDYTVDGKNSEIIGEIVALKYCEWDIHSFLYNKFKSVVKKPEDIDKLILIGPIHVRASVVGMLLNCEYDGNGAEKARRKIAKMSTRIHYDVEKGIRSYAELGDCHNLDGEYDKDMALAFMDCVKEMEEKPFNKKTVIRYSGMCDACYTLEDISFNGLLFDLLYSKHKIYYYEDGYNYLVGMHRHDGHRNRLVTFCADDVVIETSVDEDGGLDKDGNPYRFLDDIRFDGEVPKLKLVLERQNPEWTIGDSSRYDDSEYVKEIQKLNKGIRYWKQEKVLDCGLRANANIEVLIRAMIYMDNLNESALAGNKASEAELQERVKMTEKEWKEFLKGKDVLFFNIRH